ncbi:FAD-dependent oxidoreductase [Nostocoides sp. Soil756]|jgi:3-phenylpropionate/trans-cinnamate dioxygenase ferredoxin reductase subunit|uniref:NAD(P)/FAD-dependent oxidoreductase n=1 Tax=Nostocoides sp. Soil756 TaxID=1736399 RepID=UPI0006FE737A|nr:FAD-dependent oxidoreductase [Tetrasphaera sp. Soil756]KRE60652.1 pyridine nucleotide-disulfide oxidoreductase [Tetrasphaera sp. Soil756]
MSIVIVGAGLAGATAATELREQGYTGQVVLLGSEEHPPYERPPLSKTYLLGQDPFEKALVHPPEWYPEHDVDLRLGTTATALDTDAHVVSTTGGDITYEKLLLATGAEPRTLTVAEEAGVPVAYLRTLEDSDRLKEAFQKGRRIVVVGAGWIGLEVAAAARTAGCEVTVYETEALPLLRVLGPTVADVFADLHREHGVHLRLGAAVTAADLEGADLVVAGIGVTPRVDLARSAGLSVDNGVLVDARLRSSVPSVYAVGDIANHAHPGLGRRIRVEHWDTAIKQAKVAAHNLAGADEDYDELPYFFTDQYDLGMEYVGHAGADDEVVVHGSLEDKEFRAFWLRDGEVVAAMQVNDWDASDAIREAVESGTLPSED